MENNKLQIVTVLFLFFQTIVSAQQGANLPDKYYYLKNYYDATNCTKVSEFILDKEESNKFIAVFDVNDSLTYTYKQIVFINLKDSLLNNSYQITKSYYNKDGIYYNYLDKNHRLICEEKYMDKDGNNLKLVQKWNTQGVKIYEEVNLKNRQKIKCLFPNNQIEACIQRKLIYQDNRLVVKALHGWQKIWYANGNLKCKILCKDKKVIRFFLYDENSKLTSSKKFSEAENINIDDVFELEHNKAYFYLDGSCDADCPFY